MQRRLEGGVHASVEEAATRPGGTRVLTQIGFFIKGVVDAAIDLQLVLEED